MAELPTGTVTFLFTDIEGSTTLAQHYPAELPALLARHHAILHEAIEAQHGYVFRIIGDAFCAAFHTAPEALNAALQAQRGLQGEAWDPAPVKVRMGLHTGAAQAGAVEERAGGYEGYATLARTQRVMSIAHGGQVLLSNPTAELLRGQLPAEVALRDVGEHRLKGLAQLERVWQLMAPGLIAEFPPLKSLTSVPNNLPLQLTSFVGREKEIADIEGLLNSARLVTLTGSGGTGKTRLAQEVGAEELPAFANGVWLIELAPLGDPAQIIPALAQVFGLQELPFHPLANLVLDYVRDKKILLLLDNCEHLIEACARLADDLLHQCAGLKILASSREALGIAGEVAYRTPSLSLPPARGGVPAAEDGGLSKTMDCESTRLFVDRARAVNSNFKLTDANASAIAQVCYRLDGIPLAIELAAARAKLLSAEQIAARLDDRFRLLIGGSRTALPRQQTLRALIDWSYDLLSDEEKHLLQFASVFVGGWTLDALEFVADDPNTLELLEQLVNKSLVVTEERESEMRYFMLETIRQYAREKLFDAKQAAMARDRHFVYFDELSEKMWESFRSENLLPMVSRANDEVENLRAALEWGLENHVEENLRLAGNFCIVSSLMGILVEGVERAGSAIRRARALPPAGGEADLHRQKLIGRALFMQGMVGMGAGNMPLTIQVLREAIATSRVTGDRLILGYSLEMYYTATGFIHAPDRDDAAREGFHIFTHEIEDSFGLGTAYMMMARVAAEQGNEREKEMYFEKIRQRMREAPGSYQVAMFHLGMGMDESARGNYEAARRIFEDGRKIFTRIGSVNFQLVMQSEIGHVERHTGNLRQAKAVYQETIRGWQEVGNRAAIAHQLECFGFLAISNEEPHRAAKLFAAAEALREKAQSPMSDYERIEYDQSIAQLRAMLVGAEFNALWAEGRSLTMEQAIQLALA
jgi:predicted ATPase/class 3 adenylate cyclase